MEAKILSQWVGFKGIEFQIAEATLPAGWVVRTIHFREPGAEWQPYDDMLTGRLLDALRDRIVELESNPF